MAGVGGWPSLMPGLDELAQGSWAGGMCRAVARHLIPEDAAYDVRDGLLDDDGNVYQRGRTTHQTSNQLGIQINGLWEGSFSPGRRTIGLSNAAFGAIAPGGGSWTTLSAIGAGVTQWGAPAAQIGEVMFLAYSSAIVRYAGSLKSANYTTGTAVFTNGSKTVTGAGTAWLANIDAGMMFESMVAGASGFVGVVDTVDTNLQVTLKNAWQGPTTAAGAYAATTLATFTFGTPNPVVAAVSNRLLFSEGRKLHMSKTIDPATGQPRIWEYDTDDYHEFPADIVGLAVLRDTVFVFTQAGVWSLSNVGLEIVDAFGNPQHRRQQISKDVVLRSPGGLAPWRDSLVLCAIDGVYVMDSSGGLELISRSITPLWQSYMAQSYIVGQIATFRDHVFVPIAGLLYVGRLDRRTKTPVGSSVPWTRFAAGEPTITTSLVVQDPYGTPKLIGGMSTSGWAVDFTGVFGTADLPAAAGGLVDGNGASVGMIVETREFVLDGGALATVRDVALEYESSDGQISVSAATGQRAAPASTPTYTALASTAAVNYTTQNPRVLGVRREARRVSFKVSSSGVTGWRLRAVRMRSRLRGRRR